jgi:hypothetical protein
MTELDQSKSVASYRFSRVKPGDTVKLKDEVETHAKPILHTEFYCAL